MLGENGIVIKQGPANVYALLPEIVDDESNELSPMMRRMLRGHYVYVLHLREQIEELEDILKGLVAEEGEYKRLCRFREWALSGG